MADFVRLERDLKNTRWTPIRPVEKQGHWLMKCSCGTRKEVLFKNYQSGKSLSCGCYNRELTRATTGDLFRKPAGTSARNHLFLVYRKGAHQRGLEFDLSREEVAVLTSQNCHYCNRSPNRILDRTKYGTNGTYAYNGIDRKDPGLGYAIDNCVTACTECNYAKGKLSYNEFLEWIDSLIEFRRKKNEP